MGYITIKGNAEDRFVEKHSEFIGYICHVETNDEAVEFINKIKAMHRKATHNVYAYILREGNISRYSDDGEPQGTAGVPVLQVLSKNGLTDVCCVVTRYFGGILLGGGGLVRAYSHAAAISVSAAEVLNMCECYRCSVECDYSLYGKISYILPEFEIITEGSDFSDVVRLTLLIKAEKFDDFYKKLVDTTNGSVEMTKSELLFENFN